jgi:hypothetical protein
LGADVACNSPADDTEKNCLLRNLPIVPTSQQIQTVKDIQFNWLLAAVIVPFVLLILIGGWGATFRSGDASAYIVGAVIVCVAESALQQLGPNPEPLKATLKYFLKNVDSGVEINTSAATIAALAISLAAWNIYFAIHDRHVAVPTVDWVQIVVFFFSLCILQFIRFSGTEYEDPSDSGDPRWTNFLLERVRGLHVRANSLVRNAESISSAHPNKGTKMLTDAIEIFHKLDDPWCEAHAATILAGTCEAAAQPREAQRARRTAEHAMSRYKSRNQ